MLVLRIQTTTAIRKLLTSNDIYVSKVLANIENLYQPLDITLNGYAKAFMKRVFTESFATKISEALFATKVSEALSSGKASEDIHITSSLSKLKSLQVNWIAELYAEMTSVWGKNVILKGWEK